MNSIHSSPSVVTTMGAATLTRVTGRIDDHAAGVEEYAVGIAADAHRAGLPTPAQEG